MPCLALGLELIACGGLGHTSVRVVGSLLFAGGAVHVVQAHVAAPGSGEQLCTSGHRRLPVEDHGVVGWTDDHCGTGHGARLEQGLLDACPGQPVREIAHRFVVGEVGLVNPTPGLVTDHPVDLTLRGLLLLHDESTVVHCPGAQDDARYLDLVECRSGLEDVPRHRERQLLEPCACDGGDDEDLYASGLQVRLDHLGKLAGLGHVGLVQHDDAGALGEWTATQGLVGDILRELRLDGVEVAEGITAGVQGGAVDDVDQDRTAFHVPQELQAQALALARARDEPGHIGHGESLVAGDHHAKVGDQRREGVVGDLGPGRAQDRDQAGLAGRRVADQCYIGEGLQLEHDLKGLAGVAQQGEPGSLASS